MEVSTLEENLTSGNYSNFTNMMHFLTFQAILLKNKGAQEVFY